MKKFLIATTALVATAGVAAAEVTLSGNGRMGVTYNQNEVLGGKSALNFSSRIRVVFTLSGETDGGLQFGGSFRADNAGAGGAKDGLAGNVYISGAFGQLAMGDTLGAAEEVIGDLPEVGFQDLSSTTGLPSGAFKDRLAIGQNDISYLTGDNGGANVLGTATGPNALYTYSTGALKFALSMNDGRNGAATDAQDFALGVKYTMDAYSVALAYEVSKPVVGASAKHLIIGGEATFADTTVKAFYGDGSGIINGFKQYGLGVTSKFDAITAKAYIKKQEFGAADVLSWGLGGEYSLGGGATLAGGIADNDLPGSKMVADFGVKFAF